MSALCDLNKAKKRNQVLKEEVSLLILQVQEDEEKEKKLTSQLEEYGHKYVVEVGQKQKGLDASLVEIKSLVKENERQKEQMQDLKVVTENVTLLKLQRGGRRKKKVLKSQFQGDISQKKKEIDILLTEIDKLSTEKLLDDERKNNIAQLKIKAKEEGEAPCVEDTSSQSPQTKIDENPDSGIPQRPNENEGKKKIKNFVAPRSNVEGFKDKDQQKDVHPPRKNVYKRYSRQENPSRYLIFLMVIVFHVLFLGIWLGILNIITRMII